MEHLNQKIHEDHEEKSVFLNESVQIEKENQENSKFLLTEPCNEIKIQVKSTNDTKEVNKNKRRKGWRKYTGLLLAILASFLFSIVALFVKTLQLRGYHSFSLSVWRQFFNVIPSAFLIIYYRYGKKKNIFEQVWPINTKENRSNVIGLLIRAFMGASAIILRFLTLNYLTIADSSVVQYSAPIFVVILSHVFLKEKSGVTAVSIGIWTLLGVVLIARPPFLTGTEIDVNILIGTAICLSSVLFQTTSIILVRKIRKVHFAVMTFTFGAWGVVQGLILAVAFDVMTIPANYTDLGLTALLGIISYFAQIFAIMSLKFEQAGPISLIRTTDVIWAFVWQIIIMNVMPDLFSILGACVVIVGIFMTAGRKWISTLPEENNTRKSFGFLLK